MHLTDQIVLIRVSRRTEPNAQLFPVPPPLPPPPPPQITDLLPRHGLGPPAQSGLGSPRIDRRPSRASKKNVGTSDKSPLREAEVLLQQCLPLLRGHRHSGHPETDAIELENRHAHLQLL